MSRLNSTTSLPLILHFILNSMIRNEEKCKKKEKYYEFIF